MMKEKTNALEALRALIAERQQYEQWISVLESKRDGTPAHVFEKVHGDYNTRLQRVVTEIKGHAEDLQLSISALSSRLVEVARDEDTRRDALQEAELRAAVGEYETQQWDQLRSEAERGLEKVAADRAGLDSQLGELRSIQKLSDVGSVGDVETAVRPPVSRADNSTARDMMAAAQATTAPAGVASHVQQRSAGAAVETAGNAENANEVPLGHVTANDMVASARQHGGLPFDRADSAQSAPAVAPAAIAPPAVVPSAVAPPTDAAPVVAPPNQLPSAAPLSASGTPVPAPSDQKLRTGKTPPFGAVAAKPKPPEPRVDQSKTLKCPECGTPNYATEWYCERCGGELATM